MGKRYEGVREKVKGRRYEIYFRPYKGAKKIHRNIEASSISEAYYKRQEIIAGYNKGLDVPDEDKKRLTAGFREIWEELYRDLLTENKPDKTKQHYKRTFWRMFGEFKEKKYPHIQSPSQLSLPFFREYRNYYANDLGRPNGLRAELIFVKAIMRRLYMLGYCREELLKKLSEIKKPRARKKGYPDISKSDIKKLMLRIKGDRIDYYYPLAFIARTGRRISETTLIKKEDVEFRGFKPIRINIKAEITKSQEKAPLMRLDIELEQLIAEANRRSLRRKTPYLFCNRRGKRCTPDRVRDYLKKASRHILGIEITPHYFRHRFFTECGKANVPLADVKAISGIKDVQVLLNYYSHSTNEGQDKVLAVTRL